MDKFDATEHAESVEETPELHGDTAPASPELHGDNPPASPAKAVEDEAAEGSAFPLGD
jgi:hypothetical protein